MPKRLLVIRIYLPDSELKIVTKLKVAKYWTQGHKETALNGRSMIFESLKILISTGRVTELHDYTNFESAKLNFRRSKCTSASQSFLTKKTLEHSLLLWSHTSCNEISLVLLHVKMWFLLSSVCSGMTSTSLLCN